ncbi:hypothetical protein ACFOON_03285 [Novosphingobium piscinae]|uniref:Uncharacterized protein n=1 Tax=Novosphingobium piscinae TaxID=1507448 RepID=A0A7X1KRB4_9SPHN|nr:hypothetical protein [Novosphingobium piscinae]MBC2670619.1 hypothetical protein [Novosphingobium piscinae]
MDEQRAPATDSSGSVRPIVGIAQTGSNPAPGNRPHLVLARRLTGCS